MSFSEGTKQRLVPFVADNDKDLVLIGRVCTTMITSDMTKGTQKKQAAESLDNGSTLCICWKEIVSAEILLNFLHK